MSNLHLVKNGENNNSIENSIVITYHADDMDFITTTTPFDDQIHNLMTYNYGAGVLDISNLPTSIFDSLPNINPLFTEAELAAQEFDIDAVMAKAFLPRIDSPALDTGDNQFVSDIPDDIIGNDRIYISGIVDIGPYELKVHQLLFTSDMIKSISQDKLRIDYDNQRFLPVVTDDIYTELWNQFIDNSNHKEEFIRESKVIIKMKTLATDVRSSTDKKNIELARYEAYFDLPSKSIILSKTDEALGSMLNSIFDDGRYVFYFNELEHIFIVYINPTYKMGKSGKSNVVNEVRAGGPAVTSR